MEHKRSGSVRKEGDFKNRMEEELVCEICQELLQQPITLNQCSHTFCQMCLTKWLNSKPLGSDLQPEQLECPKCRRVTTLPPEGVAGLPINHTLQNLADIARDGLKANGEVEQPVLPMCEQHQCLSNQYCIHCNELLCSECIHDPKHKEHFERGEIRLVHKILPERLEMLSKQLQPASDLGIQAKSLKEEVEKKSEVISSNAKEARESVNAFFREVMAQIEERRKVLISAIDKNVDGKLATLDQHSQRIEEAEASASSITSMVQRLCRSRDVHALTEAQVIQEQLLLSQQSLDGLNTQLQDKHLDLLKFQGDKVLETQLNNLGTLTVCETDHDSTYLTVKHRLRVQMDGNVFKDDPSVTTPPGHLVPLIAVGSDSETYLYASGQYGQATPTGPTAAFPRNLATAAAMPRSPSEGALSTADYVYASSSHNRHVLTPTHSVRPRALTLGDLQAIRSSKGGIMYEPTISFQLSTSPPTGVAVTKDTDQLRPTGRHRSPDFEDVEVKEGIYDNLACLEIYDEVETVEESVNGKPPLPPDQRRRFKTLPVHTEVCGIQSSISRDRLIEIGAVEPVTQRPTDGVHLQDASRVGAKDNDAPSLDDSYEVLQPPPLPPDNLYRSMGQISGRTSPFPSSIYESVAIPTNRCEPEIIMPVKVINSDQLREPESNNEVYPTGICVSSSDIITITDLHNHCLRQIDQDGMFIQTFGRKGKAIWDFNSPTAVVVGADHLYVANNENGLVQKLTVDGEYIAMFGKRHLRTPRGIAISRLSGNIYVSDSKKQRVYVYRSNCTYERPIGKYESDIKFEHPVGVVFDTAGNLLVVDRGQAPCIWHISQMDESRASLLGKIGENYLHHPSDVTVTKDGSIVVTERGRMNCVSVFSPQGKVIRCFGKTGSKPGEFNGPSGVAVNSQGQIIVADQYNQRLQIFDLDPEKEATKESANQSPTPNV